MCDQDDQPVALRDSCRILFSDHNDQCSQDSNSNRRNSARIINGKNMQGCGGGPYVIKQEGQQLNSNVNYIILSKQIFPIPPYIPQISNKLHCQELFQNAAYVYTEDCDILQSNTIQVNLDENVYITKKDDFSFIELMSDQQYPSHSSATGGASTTSTASTSSSFSQTSDSKRDNSAIDKSNTNSNLLFNRLFNPWNQIISEEMYTLIESQGEIKIYNHSTNSDYNLQIIEIIQDQNIISIDKKQEDIQPNKERIIKFYVIPEEEGKNHEINLYFKIRFYDTRLYKIISSRTVQYTITIANIKANNYGIQPQILGKVQAGEMAQYQLKVQNPNSYDIQIKEMVLLKKYIYITDNFEGFTQGEKNHILQYKNIILKDKWYIKSEKENEIITYIVYQNQTGNFIDYLKMSFENSPLIIQIPIRFKVVTNTLSFQTPLFHMGVINGRQGFNSRSIVIDNNSKETIEIKDIIVHYKNNYSCITVEAIIDTDDTTTSTKSNQASTSPLYPFQSFSKIGCLNSNKHLIIQPLEENRKIGVLKIFPKILEANSQQKVFEGRIQIITNSTQNDIEVDYKFYRYDTIMNYSQGLTQFKVSPIPDETVNISKVVPSTTTPSEMRKFELTNAFSSQVKVTALKKPPTTDTFNFNNHLLITDFQETLIEVGEKKALFNFRLIGNSTKLDTYILLEFNRNFVIPIFFKVYNMHLLCAINSLSDYYDCSDLSQHELIKFGNKAINKTAIQEFRFKNDNPEVITIYSISKSQSPVSIILKKMINYQGTTQASNRVVVETGKKTPFMYIGPYDEAIFTVELNTSSIVKSYNHFIQTTTNYEQFSFLMEYNVVSGDTQLTPSKIHFKPSFNQQDKPQTIYIQNTYDVNLKVIDFQITDPRFQILNFTRTIPPKSTKQLLTLIFNRTYGYGQNIKTFNDDNFISIEDMIMWNITQSMIENSERNILSADVVVNFDIKSIFISATAEVQQLRLINESVIDFNNTETNQFYSKSLTFANTLDVPISFQLYIAPQNISSPENYISKQTQFQQEVELIFCVPTNLYKISAVKEVYDSLSNFFTNKGSEKSKEVVDPENLIQVQSRPDFDRSQQQNLISLYEAIKPFTMYYDEQQALSDTAASTNIGQAEANAYGIPNQKGQNANANANSNENSNEENQKLIYTCKEGKVTQKIKNYMTKIDFTKQLIEFYHNYEKNAQKMQESLLQILSLKKEVVEITQTTRNRPSLFNYNVKVEKGLWDKIKHFFTLGLFSTGQQQENTVTDWQSQSFSFGDWQNQLNNNRQNNQKNDILAQQQFFLTSEVLNKTIVLQPKQSIDINSLIYMPKYGDAQNNLIIKSNASGIDIIPIRGRSGVGRIKLIDVKNMSPILFSQLQNQKNKSVEEIQYRQFLQGHINNDVFIYSLTQEELEGAQKHNVDNMKNFVIKNVGQFPISIKNIYIESQPCAAYGFFILGCSCQFKLEPQQEKTITIGYKSDYPYDTIEKNLYFYTQTYHIKFKLRAQFFYKSSSSPSLTNLAPQLSPLILNDKKITDSIIEAFNIQNPGGIFGGDNFEKELQNGNSEKIIQAFLENVEKAASAETQHNLSGDDDKVINLSSEWSWMTDKMQQYLQKSPQVTVKDNINPYFNYFILSIIFMTALFFLYTFISFIWQDILSLNSKKSKYDTYQTRNSSGSISIMSQVGPQSPRVAITSSTTTNGVSSVGQSNNSTNRQKKNQNCPTALVDQDSDKGSYDIAAFIRGNKLDQSVYNLRQELEKIKELKEKQQQEMRLQKQKQIQLRKSKETALQEMKLTQAQQFIKHDNNSIQKEQNFDHQLEKDEEDDDEGVYNDEEEYDDYDNYYKQQSNISHANQDESHYNNNSNNVAQKQQTQHQTYSTKEEVESSKTNDIPKTSQKTQLPNPEQQQAQPSQVISNKYNSTAFSAIATTPVNVNPKKTLKEKPKKTNKREKDRIIVVTKDIETRSKKNSEENQETQQSQPNKSSGKKDNKFEQDNSEEEYDEDVSIVRKNSNKSSSSATQNIQQVQQDNKKQTSTSNYSSVSQSQRIKDESIQREIEQAILRQQKLKAEQQQQEQQQQQQQQQQQPNSINQRFGQISNNTQVQTNFKNSNNSNQLGFNDSNNVYVKKQQNYAEQSVQQQTAQPKGAIDESIQQGYGQSAAQKRKKSENFIVDDFHQSNEIQGMGNGNQYSVSQQQQMQKKAFLVHDHISSCGEDDDNNTSSNNIRKKKVSKASQDILTQFPQIQQLSDLGKQSYSNSTTQHSKDEQKSLSNQFKPEEIKSSNISPQKEYDCTDNPLLQQLTASYNSNHYNSGLKIQNTTQTSIISDNKNGVNDIQQIQKKKESLRDDEEVEDFEENQSKSYEQNAPSSDSSQLSSGDSLSEEDIDNFKRSNDQIKAISFRKFENGSFLGNDDDNNSIYSNNNNNNNNNNNSNSLRNSQNFSRENAVGNNQQGNIQQHQSSNSITSQGNLAPSGIITKDPFTSNISGANLAQVQTNYSRFSNTPNQMNRQDSNQNELYCGNFLSYQQESSDDDTSQPLTSINQRRYFNVFNSQPCFYPINLMSQNSAVDMNSSNDYPLGGENSFSSENAPNQQLSLGFNLNKTSSNQFSPSQSQSFQPINSNTNSRNFNQFAGNQSGSQSIIDTSNQNNNNNIHIFGGAVFNPKTQVASNAQINQKFVNQNSYINSLTRGDSETEFLSDEQSQTLFNPQQSAVTSTPQETMKIENPQMNRSGQTYSQRNNGSFNFPHMSSRSQYPQSGNIGKKIQTKSSQNDLEDPQAVLSQQQANFQKQFISQQFSSAKQANPITPAIKFPTTGPPPGMGMVNDNLKNSKNQVDYFRATPELKFEVQSVPPGLLGQTSKTSN